MSLFTYDKNGQAFYKGCTITITAMGLCVRNRKDMYLKDKELPIYVSQITEKDCKEYIDETLKRLGLE